MADYHPHPSSRPSVPPVPPQLRPTVSPSYLSNNPPPLHPAPADYRAQAVADQLFLAQPNPHHPPPSSSPAFSLTADNLRQADYLNSFPPGPPSRAHSTRPLQPQSRREPQLARAHSHNSLRGGSLDHGPQLALPNSDPAIHPQIGFPDSAEYAYYPSSAERAFLPSPARSPTTQPIAVPVIDLDLLTVLYQESFKKQPDPVGQIKWASKVLKFIERSQASEPMATPSSSPTEPDTTRISDPTLVKYTDVALKTILRLAEHAHQTPAAAGEALYLRGDLSSTGAFPSYRVKDLKSAFRDFEAAAQLSYHLAWFRIGREYEMCEDWDRAVGAYEHGLGLGECACIYRLGMCHLLGQINLPVDLVQAVGYLKSAANLADEETPQPAYIYGMLLAGEFESLPHVSPDILRPNPTEARQMIEKAAYLGFAAAQYKIGWCYEYGQMECAFDPLLSVEYYSLASKQGESEADMALSKWFLCGAEGLFQPNEALAVTFAEKAAKKGLGSAMFGLGYYLEVGIGGRQDAAAALEWYRRAWEEAGNSDARERLGALEGGQGMLSRDEHEHHLDERVVHKHTLAAERSPLDVLQPSTGVRRRETMRRVEEARRVAEMGMLASTLSPVRMLSAPPSPAPSSLSLDSPEYRGPGGSAYGNERPAASQPLTPTALQARAPLQTSQGRPGPGFDPEHTAGQLRTQTNRMTKYQLTDEPAPPPTQPASQGLAPNSGPGGSGKGRRKVDHITTAKPNKGDKQVQFNSFADMGIATAKAKKSEDCVIV